MKRVLCENKVELGGEQLNLGGRPGAAQTCKAARPRGIRHKLPKRDIWIYDTILCSFENYIR